MAACEGAPALPPQLLRHCWPMKEKEMVPLLERGPWLGLGSMSCPPSCAQAASTVLLCGADPPASIT